MFCSFFLSYTTPFTSSRPRPPPLPLRGVLALPLLPSWIRYAVSVKFIRLAIQGIDPVLREDVAGPSLTRRRCSTVKHLSLEGKVLDEPHDCVCYPFPFVPKPPPTSLNRGVIPPRLPAVAAVAIGEGR